MQHYRTYSNGSAVGSTQSGYYQNLGGSLTFSTTQPSDPSGNLEVEGGWKSTGSGECICIQGAGDTPVTETINRVKSCI
jgi:hypothetical protein